MEELVGAYHPSVFNAEAWSGFSSIQHPGGVLERAGTGKKPVRLQYGTVSPEKTITGISCLNRAFSSRFDPERADLLWI